MGAVETQPELMDANFEALIGPPAVARDWAHANAIAYNPERKEIAWSSRHFNEIYIIDHSTTTEEAAGHSGGDSGKGGDFLYRWGNPQAYRQGTTEDQRLFGPHDVRWIPKGYPNAGKIMVFNNGLRRPEGDSSTVDILEPPLDNQGSYFREAGKAYGPTDLFWSYSSSDLYSAIMSGAQPLPNGNILICEADDLHFTEVSPEGTLVWEYVSPAGNTGPVSQGNFAFGDVFRATRYSAFYSAFLDKDLEPGAPIELDPLPSDCVIYEEPTTLYNTPLPTPVRLLQNPIDEQLSIHNPTGNRLEYRIFDLNGRLVHEQISAQSLLSWSTQHWPSGLYLLQVVNREQQDLGWLKIVKNR